MKKIKKIMALVIALAMVLSMGTVAFAQTEGTAAEGKGSITISNAAKGETYSVVKIFGATLTDDATATTDASGIAYTGDIPEALAGFFEKDATTGNVIRKATATDDSALVAAVQAYAKTQAPTASVESDGSELTFQGLDYGYYAVISTQGAVVTVDSLRPNAIVYDKNSKEPSADKTVGTTSYSIGDTIEYTATFNTANYLTPEDSEVTDGSDAKQVINYEISDTLPDFLSDVSVTKITIDGTEYKVNGAVPQFENKKISIPWATENEGSDPKTYTSNYKNGAIIVVEYTAKLTSTSNVNTANTNTVTITPYVDNGTGTPEPWEETWEKDAVVKTYGTALKKVDGQTKAALKGAKFKVTGLTVEAVEGEPGVYKVVSYVKDSTELGTEMTTNDDGKLYIIGIAEDVTLSATETAAPEGYNKADAAISLPAQLLTETLYETSGTRKYDAKGNLISETSTGGETRTVEKNYTMLDQNAVEVLNNKGTELPSTGGIGTTIFYVVGAILVIGAGVVLVTRRRMDVQ